MHIDQKSIHWVIWGRHCNSAELPVMKQITAAISVIHQPSFPHIFNYDRGFNHVSYLWLNAKFNGEVNKPYCKSIGTTVIKLWIIL